jgi:hypothetical protein
VNILVYPLTAKLERGPYADLGAWLAFAKTCPFSVGVERALWGGFHADRLGYAFTAGYGAALARLFDHAARAMKLPTDRPFPDPPLRGVVALCATESGGAHPKAIATNLEKRGGGMTVTGEKIFATLATAADELLVVASRGVESDGRNRLRIVRVSPRAPGVSIEPRPETPFAPEIPHAIVRFAGAEVADADVLPGDGYDAWLKPFRTIEDTHVLASTIGYLLGAARAYEWSHGLRAELTSLAHALVDIAARDASAAVTHVLLQGVFRATRRLLGTLDQEWEKASSDERDRWRRDAPLLQVADGVRAKRAEAAWRTLLTKAATTK